MGNLNSKEKIIVDVARKNGEKNNWDDIHFLTDEELLAMYPLHDLDGYEEVAHHEYDSVDAERLLDIVGELKQIYEEIAYNERMIDDPSTRSSEVTELRTDIINLKRKAERLMAESEEIRKRYEGRSK